MAKKKKDPNKTPKGDKNSDARYDERVAAIRARDEAKAREFANEIYGPGSLGRSEAPAPVANVANPEKIGMISTDMEGGQQSIAQAESAYNQAQIRDQYVQDALMRMQQGLGGYNSQEMQAMRAQGARAIAGNTQTALRTLRGAQGAEGVTGSGAASAQAKILREGQRARGAQETDLIAKNAEEQRLRLGQYGDYAGNAYKDHEAVKSEALQRLFGIRQDVSNFRQTSEIQNQGAQQKNIENTMDTNRYNTDINKYNVENARENARFNIGQAEKEKSGYLGAFTGDQQVTEAMREKLKQEELSKQMIGIAKKGVGGGGRSSADEETKGSKKKTKG